MARRRAGRALVGVGLAVGILAGCRAAAPPAAPAATAPAPAAKAPEPEDPLHDLVDRRVLSSRPVDHCLDRWGKGTSGWFEVDFEIDPSGRLTPLEARGGDANLNACLFSALRQLRLPAGSVKEPRRVSISIR